MDEPLRFQILDTARTLFHMHERIELTSYGSTTRHLKRLKCIPEAPHVLKQRLLLDKKLPTYTLTKPASPSLIRDVLNEVFGLKDDVFEELFETMKPLWGEKK